MNLEEFESWVSDNDGWDSFDWEDRSPIHTPFGEVEVVESVGGEGQGDYAAIIFSVDGQFYRKEGYYASHYGTTWDGALEPVRQVEKTITVWEA